MNAPSPMISMAEAEATLARVDGVMRAKLDRAHVASKIVDWGHDLKAAGACLLDVMTIRHALEEEFGVEITDKQELALLDMDRQGVANMMEALMRAGSAVQAGAAA